MKATINAKGMEIRVLSKGDENDFISLTDIARYKNPEFPADVVKNWMRTRSTIEFLGLWEQLNNPDFKLVEFDQFRNEAGANAFVLNPQKWISATNAVGMLSKSGRYCGTFAYKDIAFEFASYAIKDNLIPHPQLAWQTRGAANRQCSPSPRRCDRTGKIAWISTPRRTCLSRGATWMPCPVYAKRVASELGLHP